VFLDREFFWVHLGLAGTGIMIMMLCAAEVGVRFGRRGRKTSDDPTRSQYTAIEGAALAVVGLLLAFTFSMSASRFENRKQIVVNEANALGTAWLRAQLLPESEGQEVRSLLRSYVDAWLELHEGGPDVTRHAAASKELDRLQDQLWSRASAAARRDPNSVTMSLLLQSLNEVFDRQSELMAAVANRVPGVVLLLLTVTAAVSLGMVGYCSGLAGRRNFVATFTLGLLIAGTILVILDFDRPRRGLIQLSPRSMIVLRESMDRPAP